MSNLSINIKLLTDQAKMPEKAHADDACFDIYSDFTNLNLGLEDVLSVPPHTTVKVPTGFATEIPHGYWCPIYARSGIATKEGLRLAQGVAVIDENYRGEWMIPIHNDTDQMRYIRHNERIAQFNLMENFNPTLNVVDSLSDTDRGVGGFGSSGK